MDEGGEQLPELGQQRIHALPLPRGAALVDSGMELLTDAASQGGQRLEITDQSGRLALGLDDLGPLRLFLGLEIKPGMFDQPPALLLVPLPVALVERIDLPHRDLAALQMAYQLLTVGRLAPGQRHQRSHGGLRGGSALAGRLLVQTPGARAPAPGAG